MKKEVRNSMEALKAIQLNWRKTDAGLQYAKGERRRGVRK
jgi:hypothetical protein